MPYNFQGAGGIINTGPIEDIYYLDPVTFTDSLSLIMKEMLLLSSM